jgi:signal transduction histidine kinase/ActR/RegA family two-component response regulator
MRIKRFLALMAIAVLLPLLMASAFAIHQIWKEEHAAAMASLQKTVFATVLLIDKDVAASISALQTLSNSEHLVTANYAAFYQQAKAINRTPNSWTALLRSDGTQVLNTSVPFEEPQNLIPSPDTVKRIALVLATQKPYVSDIFLGQRTGRQIVAVYVPTEVKGTTGYVVVQAFALEHWKNFDKNLDFSADWIIAVLDRNGQLIARSRGSEKFVGRLARPELINAASQANTGLLTTKTLEGIESYVAFEHSDMTEWTIAAAAPTASIDEPVVRALEIAVGGFLIALLTSVALASTFGRRFIAAMQTSSTAAESLGRGQTPEVVSTSIIDVNELNQSLSDAGELLERERNARLVAEMERERLQQVERTARITAEKESKAKDNFLAMLGHELRSPLAAISGAVSVLTRSTPASPDTHRYLSIIHRQNRHLTHIIDDLLEMSRLIAGKIELQRHPVNLAESLQSCVDSLKAAGRTANHTVTVKAEQSWCSADPIRIEQIFNNLIGNAIKFSPVGTTINIGLRTHDDFVVITVQDQGIGMSPELISEIFEPFVQGPAPLTGSQTGMGIGLALVKQLVELHGGTVTVASAGQNSGSTFTISLPKVDAPASESCSSFGHLMTAKPRTLLYVEDNNDARTVMSEMLRMYGYIVIEASNGADALAAVALRKPDAVVLDIGLPDMTGYDVGRRMRELPDCSNLPILAVTGYGQLKDKDKTQQLGFSAHLVKPVEADDLILTLETMLADKP